MLLALPLKQLPKVGLVFGYLDNFLVMATSEDDAVSMAKALGCALQAHPAGPLRPKIKGIFHAGTPIDFLGYRLTAQHGAVMIEPSPAKRQEFEAELKAGLARIKGGSLPPAVRTRKIQHLRTYIRCWTAAFRLWPGAEKHRDLWLAKVDDCS